MCWTTPSDIRAQVRRLWDRGKLLACLVPEITALQASDEQCPTATDLPATQILEFPLKLHLRRPGPSDLSARFEDARAWITALEKNARPSQGFGYDIQWAQINNRQLGRNKVPAAIVLDTVEDAFAIIKKNHEAKIFLQLSLETLKAFPQLEPWLQRKPIKLLNHAEDWERILAVLTWVRRNPQSRLYLRQIDVENIDTKFIEARKTLLGELLDLVLSPDAINATWMGAKNFEIRYGFVIKPPLIRFRVLDERHAICGLTDLTVRADEFARLDLKITRIYIIENEVDGLAFPQVPDAIAIFGMGYALRLLFPAKWLQNCDIYYWGDIDTHGFAMLDRLRTILPHARSLLMDHKTLLDHQVHWTDEHKPHTTDLNQLTPDEQRLYDDLRCNRLGNRLRLEQERVSFGRLETVLKEL